MKNLYTLLLGFMTIAMSAQEAGTKHILTYLNLNVFSGTVETTLPDGTDPIRTFESSSFSLGNFTPALGIYHLNGNFSEIELTTLAIGSEDEINLVEGNNRDIAGKTSTFGLGVRYEYNLPIVESDALALYAAASINPTIQSKKLKPESEYLYTTTIRSFTLPIALAPKMIYSMGESFFLTLSIPISILELGSNSINYESTVVPSGGQKVSEGISTFLPARTHIRLGIGARF